MKPNLAVFQIEGKPQLGQPLEYLSSVGGKEMGINQNIIN